MKLQRFHNYWPAILSGLLLGCSYPLVAFTTAPINNSVLFSILAWITPSVFFLSLGGDSKRPNFFKGWLFGLCSNAVILYWITHSMVYFGNLSWFASVCILLVLIFYLSLYPALWALLFGLVSGKFGDGLKSVWLGATLWILLEYLKTYLLTGFGWCTIGYTQGNNLLAAQIADLGGIYLVSFWVICLNLLFANIFKALMLQKKHAALKNFTVVVLFIAINLSYGTFRYHQYNHPNIPATDNFKISLIQGNIPQEKKWSPTSRQEILTTYLEQTAAVIKESDLIVWPEASYPYSLAADIKRIPQLDLPITLLPHETSETAPLLLLGAATYLENRQEIMNSIFSVTSDGSVLQRYDKMRLVLYGEYIPLADFLPIKKLTHGLGSFTAGKLLQPLNFGSAQGSFQLAPLICYEVIYPDLARSYSKHGAGLLINVTNDAWFGVTSGPYQHINIARFRAIENRRYLARAANTGISAFIDPLGRIEPAAPINQLATLTHRIPYLNSSSIYSSFGDLACFGILTLLSLLLALTKN